MPAQPRVQTATNGSDREDLPKQCAEYDQRAGEDRFNRPSPYRHRAKAESEAGEALDKAADRRAQSYENDEMIQEAAPSPTPVTDRGSRSVGALGQ